MLFTDHPLTNPFAKPPQFAASFFPLPKGKFINGADCAGIAHIVSGGPPVGA